MGKLSNTVSGNLGDAIKEAQDLLNAGANAQKKRTRKQKEDVKPIETQDNSLFESLGIAEDSQAIEDNRPEWEKRPHKNHEEFCEWELQKAKLYNKPDPDFDYRNFYSKGHKLYLVRIYPRLGEKEILPLTIRTLYPRMMVGTLEKGYCECIGYEDKDVIFENHASALAYFNTIDIKPKYNNEYDEATGLRKRKKKKSDDAEEQEYMEENSDE